MNVAIVNDSKAAAEVLRRVLAAMPEFHHLWTAYSGEDAVRQCERACPDVILMDLIMPGIDGAETTRRIMAATPCVILVVTATTVGNRDKVFEAMGYGALDAVDTPVLGRGAKMSGAEPLMQKLRMVSRLVVAPASAAIPRNRQSSAQLADTSSFPIVAIGASTGGPQALAEILSHLPSDLPAVVLIAQHVDEQFTPGLARWLNHLSSLPVSVARDGERLMPGSVWIAGTNHHLIYDNGIARYSPDPEDTAYRPSVDVLFSSLAARHQAPRVGVLLTGMGRDGAQGLLALRDAGSFTIAQDAATSVVYGMPKAAAELNAAVEVLPLASIAPRITEAILFPERAVSSPRPARFKSARQHVAGSAQDRPEPPIFTSPKTHAS